MKIPVVITEKEYKKGEHVFSEYTDSIEWISCAPDEKEVARSIRSSGARIVVLGVEKYTGDLYLALKENAGQEPSLIARHGVGFDGIDLALCKKYNILLANTPQAVDRSVAEHAFALLLSIARKIPTMDSRMHNNEFKPERGFELFRKSLGIVGLGSIGKKTALIASKGFGMRVFAFDALPLSIQAAKESMSANSFLSHYGLKEYFTDFESFIKKVDVVSIHLPVNEKTRYFFNEERLNKMKPGSILINTSRGALIDEKALFKALASSQLKAAGVDVFNKEPYEPISPEYDLRKLDNIILTPHIASDTFEANENIERKVMENIGFFLEKKYEKMNLIN